MLAEIRAAILEGDMDTALKRTQVCYPDVLRENPRIYFRLRCRKFVEMMRLPTISARQRLPEHIPFPTANRFRPPPDGQAP